MDLEVIEWSNGGGNAPEGVAMQFSMDLEPPRPKWPSPSREPGDNSLFFAILPEPGIAARIETLGGELRAAHGLSGRPISAKRLHMTLGSIADYSILLDYDVTSALEAAGTIVLAPFEIVFNRLQSFEGEDGYPLVLRCGDGLAAPTGLQKALNAALRATGYEGKVPAGDAPHITLLHDRRPIDETFLDEPIGWTVRDFALVYSVYGESRHMELGRWPLSG
jgi:RNA 2',3'-cyclic 3'-phosphodiesterase